LGCFDGNEEIFLLLLNSFDKGWFRNTVLGRWPCHTTLREQYPCLYNIVCHKSDGISMVIETPSPNVTFRRELLGCKLLAWNALLQCLDNVQLLPGVDEFLWNLHMNGKFSVDSMYKAMLLPEVPVEINNKIKALKDEN
jgi:hypothetical protein